MTSGNPDFDRWEQRFSVSDYLFGTEPNVFLKSQAHRLRPGMTALAIADGEGRNGVWLASQGLDVLSIDFSPTALGKARALAAERGVALRTEQADLTRWAWPESAFDVIAAIFIQSLGPPHRPGIFASIKRALKPGGLLLLQGYRPEQIGYGTGGPRDVDHLYTRALLEESFGDLEIITLREHDSVIHEGHGHDGMSALIDLVARRA